MTDSFIALGGVRVDQGLDVVAFRTPTLPPATTTNTSLVGRNAVWIVDPATPYPDEQSRLLDAIDASLDRSLGTAASASRREVAGIFLTHHHPDHVGAAVWLREQRGWQIHAHHQTSVLLGAGVVDVLLEEGDVLETGARTTSDGNGDHPRFDGPGDTDDGRWHVLHTPGHASGHLVLWEPQRRLMIAGDMVAATGTIVVDPPDGHMATYIAQLRRLAALRPSRLVPAHGPVVERPVELLEYYLKHRLGREAKILAAVGQRSWKGLAAVTEIAYADVPKTLHPLAARAALAHLVKLEEDGRIQRRGSEVAAASMTIQAAQAGAEWAAGA